MSAQNEVQNKLMSKDEFIEKLEEEGATGHGITNLTDDCIFSYFSDTPEVLGCVYTRVAEGILAIPITAVYVDDGYEQLDLADACIIEPEELERMADMTRDLADAMSAMAREK